MIELEATLSKQRGEQNQSNGFHITKSLRLVPEFDEDDPHEKVAQSFQWPKKSWVAMIQTVFERAARSVYLSLSFEDITSFDKDKVAVLRAMNLLLNTIGLNFGV